jgi:hypothetical protein
VSLLRLIAVLPVMPSFFHNLLKKEADESEHRPPGPSDRHIKPPTLLTAMNLASPFAAAAGEQFTVRELTILLPPQFVRAESLQGDQAVPLPIDQLRDSLQQGRPSLRLSQIYMACPFLFSRQVQPAEDMEIVLPFQKVKRMLENVPAASPFAAAGAMRGTESPFGGGASPFLPAGNSGGTAASPFAVRADGNSPGQNEVLSPSPEPRSATPNPFQRMDSTPAPLRPATSPFQLVSAAAEAPSPASGPGVPVMAMSTPSPFSRPDGSESPVRPRTDIVPVAESPAPATPFQTAHPPAAAAPSPVVRPHTDFVRLEAAGSAPAVTEIRVLLSTLLREVNAEDLGFDPSAVPDHVEAVLPIDAITPQLATGRVEVSVEELRQGVEERFRPAFARVRPGLRFLVPLSEVFRSLPPDAIPAPQAAPHIPISTSPFQTPFALRADDEANGGKPALPQFVAPAPPAPAHPVAHFPVIPPLTDAPKAGTAPVKLPSAPPAAAMESGPTESVAAAVSLPFQIPHPPASAATGGGAPAKLPGLPPLPKLSGAPVRPSPFSRPPGMPPPGTPEHSAEPPAPVLPPVAPASLPKLPSMESHDDLGQPFNAASLQSEPPIKAPAAEPFDPSKLFSGRPAVNPPPPPPAAPVARPAPRPAAVSAAPAAPPIEFNFGETPDLARVTLRAIYDTDQDLSVQEIVDRMAHLPGLRAAVIILNGRTIAGDGGSSGDEVRQFTASAPKSGEYLSGLAESMGYGSSGTFTLRAGRGVRTFFVEGGNCLAVLHDESTFAPGVRDKLLLTARTLAEIAD